MGGRTGGLADGWAGGRDGARRAVGDDEPLEQDDRQARRRIGVDAHHAVRAALEDDVAVTIRDELEVACGAAVVAAMAAARAARHSGRAGAAGTLPTRAEARGEGWACARRVPRALLAARGAWRVPYVPVRLRRIGERNAYCPAPT